MESSTERILKLEEEELSIMIRLYIRGIYEWELFKLLSEENIVDNIGFKYEKDSDMLIIKE